MIAILTWLSELLLENYSSIYDMVLISHHHLIRLVVKVSKYGFVIKEDALVLRR